MYSYKVKVRSRGHERTYLWGGQNIALPLTAQGLFLTMQVDEAGEEILVLASDERGGNVDIGRLLPGETYTLSLHLLRGIYARCQFDSIVTCTIHGVS